MKATKILFVVSWVLLTLAAALLLLGSFASLTNPLTRQPDELLPGVGIERVAEGDPAAVDAIRGRRVTAASWALGCGLFLAIVTLIPYRRGERWAWWAILVAMGISQLASLARVPMLGMNQGAGVSGILLAVVLLALMAGAPRIFVRGESGGITETD